MRVFLATPFSSKIDVESRQVVPEYREFVEGILKVVRQNGDEVFCAVEHEGWAIQDGEPVAAWQKDVEEIKSADIFVAILEERTSAGVQLEIGMALAWNKRVILVTENEDQVLQWSNSTICANPDHDILLVKGVTKLKDALRQVLLEEV